MYRFLEIPSVYNLSQSIFIFFYGKALDRVRAVIRENCFGRVLELGCGTGKFADLLGNLYCGVDISYEYLKNISGEKGRFICSDAARLPFADGLFDSIYCHGMFHHIAVNHSKGVLAEARRVCRPDGRIVISDQYYPESRFDGPGFLVNKLDRGSHVRTLKAFKKELENQLRIVEIVPIQGSYPFNLKVIVLDLK